MAPSAQAADLPPQTPKPEEAKAIAMDAYIYGYSLITTDVTRVQMSNVPKVEGLHAPAGQFINVPRYPPADYRGVSVPNADTLYSLAWLDLGKEPMVFSHPDMGKRYFLFPMYSLWMPVIESAGSRTTGKADYVYEAPPVDPSQGFSMTDKPQQVILDMGTKGYFDRMTKLMCKDAPPAPEDAPMLAKMAKIGIEPCKPFDMDALAAPVRAVLKDLPQTTLEQIEADKPKLGEVVNGWIVSKGLGDYGTDYVKRAVVAAFGWPANLEKDAVYPYTEVDSTGATLSGANNYALTFAKDQTPPVDGFWSITMYEIDNGWWFVPNALNKFTVSPRDDLTYNDDGSLTLYFQHASPGKDKEANWLPAPKGDFIPMLRMYWPKEKSPSIIDGTWTPPKVEKVQ